MEPPHTKRAKRSAPVTLEDAVAEVLEFQFSRQHELLQEWDEQETLNFERVRRNRYANPERANAWFRRLAPILECARRRNEVLRVTQPTESGAILWPPWSHIRQNRAQEEATHRLAALVSAIFKNGVAGGETATRQPEIFHYAKSCRALVSRRSQENLPVTQAFEEACANVMRLLDNDFEMEIRDELMELRRTRDDNNTASDEELLARAALARASYFVMDTDTENEKERKTRDLMRAWNRRQTEAYPWMAQDTKMTAVYEMALVTYANGAGMSPACQYAWAITTVANAITEMWLMLLSRCIVPAIFCDYVRTLDDIAEIDIILLEWQRFFRHVQDGEPHLSTAAAAEQESRNTFFATLTQYALQRTDAPEETLESQLTTNSEAQNNPERPMMDVAIEWVPLDETRGASLFQEALMSGTTTVRERSIETEEESTHLFVTETGGRIWQQYFEDLRQVDPQWTYHVLWKCQHVMMEVWHERTNKPVTLATLEKTTDIRRVRESTTAPLKPAFKSYICLAEAFQRTLATEGATEKDRQKLNKCLAEARRTMEQQFPRHRLMGRIFTLFEDITQAFDALVWDTTLIPADTLDPEWNLSDKGPGQTLRFYRLHPLKDLYILVTQELETRLANVVLNVQRAHSIERLVSNPAHAPVEKDVALQTQLREAVSSLYAQEDFCRGLRILAMIFYQVDLCLVYVWAMLRHMMDIVRLRKHVPLEELGAHCEDYLSALSRHRDSWNGMDNTTFIGESGVLEDLVRRHRMFPKQDITKFKQTYPLAEWTLRMVDVWPIGTVIEQRMVADIRRRPPSGYVDLLDATKIMSTEPRPHADMINADIVHHHRFAGTGSSSTVFLYTSAYIEAKQRERTPDVETNLPVSRTPIIPWLPSQAAADEYNAMHRWIPGLPLDSACLRQIQCRPSREDAWMEPYMLYRQRLYRIDPPFEFALDDAEDLVLQVLSGSGGRNNGFGEASRSAARAALLQINDIFGFTAGLFSTLIAVWLSSVAVMFISSTLGTQLVKSVTATTSIFRLIGPAVYASHQNILLANAVTMVPANYQLFQWLLAPPGLSTMEINTAATGRDLVAFRQEREFAPLSGARIDAMYHRQQETFHALRTQPQFNTLLSLLVQLPDYFALGVALDKQIFRSSSSSSSSSFQRGRAQMQTWLAHPTVYNIASTLGLAAIVGSAVASVVDTLRSGSSIFSVALFCLNLRALRKSVLTKLPKSKWTSIVQNAVQGIGTFVEMMAGIHTYMAMTQGVSDVASSVATAGILGGITSGVAAVQDIAIGRFASQWLELLMPWFSRILFATATVATAYALYQWNITPVSSSSSSSAPQISPARTIGFIIAKHLLGTIQNYPQAQLFSRLVVK